MRNPNGKSWLALPLLVLVLACPDARAQEPEGGDRLERFWGHLAGADAAKAYQAIVSLAQTPKETTAFIKARLQPVAVPDAAKVKQWIDELSSSRFAVRSKANTELQQLAELAEPSLRSAAKNAPSLETRRRVEELLSRLQGPVVTLPAQLRALRAVEALEYSGDDAKALLRSYAAGAPAARLTQASAAALERLARRPAEAPTTSAKTPRTDRYGDALPPGTLARLGTVRFRLSPSFDRRLAGFAFLPDGKTLLNVGEREEEIQLWDVATGRLLRELRSEGKYVFGFALAQGGKQFAVADVDFEGRRTQIRVCDLPSGKVVKVFPRNQEDPDRGLAFSPDGKLLFSRPAEGNLRVEEIASGKEVRTKKFSGGNIRGHIALSSDGAYLAIPADHLYLWKWQTEEPRKLDNPLGRTEWVSFSPDGKLLAAVGLGEPLCVWEVPAGRLLYKQDCRGDRGYYFYGQAVFTPDGKTLAVPTSNGIGRGEIQLLDPRTGKLQTATNAPGRVFGNSVAASADSRRLATVDGNQIRIWDLSSRTEIGANDDAHGSRVSHVRVSATGLVATAGDDMSVRLWDGATGAPRHKFTLAERAGDVQFSPDGSRLAASSADDELLVWDTRTGREIYRLAGHGKNRSPGGALGFLSDGQRFLSWGRDSYLRLWDMKDGKALAEHAIPPRFHPRAGFQPDSEMERAVITPDGKTLIINSGLAKLHLYNATTGKQERTLPGTGEYGGPLAVSPDSKYLLAVPLYTEGDESATLWDLTTAKPLQKFAFADIFGGATAFSPDGRMFAFAAGQQRSKIFVYEMASGKVRCTIRGLRGPSHCLAFFPDSRRLAVGLNDSTAVIWDLRELSGQ